MIIIVRRSCYCIDTNTDTSLLSRPARLVNDRRGPATDPAAAAVCRITCFAEDARNFRFVGRRRPATGRNELASCLVCICDASQTNSQTAGELIRHDASAVLHADRKSVTTGALVIVCAAFCNGNGSGQREIAAAVDMDTAAGGCLRSAGCILLTFLARTVASDENGRKSIYPARSLARSLCSVHCRHPLRGCFARAIAL